MESANETTEVESKEWYMAAYVPQGIPTSDHLKLRTQTISLALDSIPDGYIAVEMLFVSVDPYLRMRMSGCDEGLYMPQFDLHQVIKSVGIGKVVKSKDSDYNEGDIVLHFSFPVAEYCVFPTDPSLRKIDTTSGISLPEYLSIFGVPGFAAWIGIVAVGEAEEGSDVFISAAAGGVGMLAGQLAKLRGCRVIGSAGSDDKVKLVKEEFGYDDAFNYRTELDFNTALAKYFPDGIDLYLDNVGGKMLEAVLNHVNHYARISLCGMISQYNKVWEERDGVRNLLNLVGKEVRMEGFLLSTYFDRFADFAKEMEGYLIEGKIRSKHHIYNGIESFSECIGSMFSSSNNGKVIIQIK